jgi:alkanesulfonate monooxygenase SsuD/methylene tetrahydromethanopterin reductase-like flavin-dependent oxidoreductase (luciferase family)
VFVFDHLWPLGHPDRPALHSLALLGALAAETERLVLGPLVARVGLQPDAVLVHAFETLARMTGPDRLIAALGTGDSANRAENEAYGVPFPPKADRLARLETCCRALRRLGIRTWAGGNSAEVRTLAGVVADGWNGWGTDADTFAAQASGLGVEVSWGGQVLVGRDEAEAAAKLERHGPRPGLVHGTVDNLGAHLQALHDAGASWAICAPLDVGRAPDDVELVAEAATHVTAGTRDTS